MESDLEESLETVSDLFESESDHILSNDTLLNGFSNSNSYISFRNDAISLILQAQYSSNFEPFISYLALNYMDRYVLKQEIPLGKPWISRLLVLACLSLAAKMKNASLSLSDIQREDNLVFDIQTVHKMELLILDALSWRMRPITPFSFFTFFFSTFFELNHDDNVAQLVKDRASEIIFSSQSDINFIEFKPSIIAASSILSASFELLPSQFSCLKASFSACQYINSENLWKCFNMMQEYGLNMGMSSTRNTAMSVLEHKFTNSETSLNFTNNNDNTTSSTAQQCDNLVSEKEENKRRSKLNGLCTKKPNSGFKISHFHPY